MPNAPTERQSCPRSWQQTPRWLYRFVACKLAFDFWFQRVSTLHWFGRVLSMRWMPSRKHTIQSQQPWTGCECQGHYFPPAIESTSGRQHKEFWGSCTSSCQRPGRVLSNLNTYNLTTDKFLSGLSLAFTSASCAGIGGRILATFTRALVYCAMLNFLCTKDGHKRRCHSAVLCGPGIWNDWNTRIVNLPVVPHWLTTLFNFASWLHPGAWCACRGLCDPHPPKSMVLKPKSISKSRSMMALPARIRNEADANAQSAVLVFPFQQ